MSRIEFRAEVPDARPPSAWLLVTVAGATLWITEQLMFFTIVLQAAAILYSLVTRSKPAAWQTSPVTLNLGMFGIVGVTISLALQGHPATVSLAHFAALTQGLQLLDTRPRKSEFLLVALALFQVILAANLTDSVLFPPLLAIFLVATTWTLLVHTLRTEAIESGSPAEAAQSAISAGLLRTTLSASLISILLAMVLFVLLPRMRTSMIQGGLGANLTASGFSDRVELGTIGRIRKDPSVVLRVETLKGELPPRSESYWRGLAFDTFDGREWSISPISSFRLKHHVPGAPRFGVDLNGGQSEATLVQRVIREPVEAGVVFGLGRVRRIEGPLGMLEIDANGGVYAPRQSEERVRYSVWSSESPPNDAALDRDRTTTPPDRAQPPREPGHYLKLPELDPKVHELAQEIVAPHESDAAKARAIELHLRRAGSYTDTPPDMTKDGAGSPIEGFLLGGLAGHCEYFASGMVVLARSSGLPARLVNGFAGGRVNKFGGFVELARSDAHAWVEIHYERAGWVRYDPTPPDLRMRDAFASNIGERLAELFSVMELWWFQRVVDFDTSDQIQAMKAAWNAWRSLRSTTQVDERQEKVEGLDFKPVAELPWIPMAGGAALVALLWEWRRRSKGANPKRPLPAAYVRALRVLARRGLVRAPTATARDFAQEVSTKVSEEAATAFDALTESYLCERFGAGPPQPRAAELQALRQALREAPPSRS